ncbi:hypothetical protein JCM10908_004351 [Rhodotorula pacifica]|uniref:uncharacterized protein n=1 Tax=Rhodotorula pacifica TaxID=1495444 RepID=UPI00317ED2EE
MAQRMRPTIQAVEDRVVTLQSSLQQVRELLETGIGCVAYLRGLLPEDSFADYRLVARRPPDLQSASGSQKQGGKEGATTEDDYTYVRVKKLKRGVSPETNKLLDYLEVGAAQAIEKGYLHKLVFAIYLDPDNPTNLVESYTFTFTYETDAEGNKHPDMQVADQFSSMDLSAAGIDLMPRDKPRKMSDVKRQVQRMIKNLITSTQVMEELPRRRFINVRLFYTEDTPADYEPPHFHPVPLDAPGYSLTTPSVQHAPEYGTLGSMATGYHGVALHYVSTADILDVAYDENVSLDEALARNKRDAETRPVVWDAESLAQAVTDEDAKRLEAEPIGVKDLSGQFIPIKTVMDGQGEEMDKLKKRTGILPNPEAVFEPQGRMDETIVDSNMSDNEALRRAIAATEKRPPTNSMPATQIEPVVSRVKSYQPPAAQFDDNSEAHGEGRMLVGTSAEGASLASGRVLKRSVVGGETKKAGAGEAAEVETQLFDYSQLSLKGGPKAKETPLETLAEPDTVEGSASVTAPRKRVAGDEQVAAGKSAVPTRRSTRAKASFSADACECGDKEDDGGMICCSTCEVWKHAICYGFEDAHDSRIPDIFVCYHCRAEKGLADLTMHPDREAQIRHALDELRSLALFRRAIDAIWHNGVMSMKDLAKHLAVDNATAGQVLKRLKAESFITEQGTTSRKGKGRAASQIGSLKAGAASANKCVLKTAYSVTRSLRFGTNRSPKQAKRKKQEYFTPGKGAELAIVSLLEPDDIDAEGEEDVNVDEPAAQASNSADRATAAKGKAPVKELVAETPQEPSQTDPIVDEESRHASPAVFGAASTSAARVNEKVVHGAAHDDYMQEEAQPASSCAAPPRKRSFMGELDPNAEAAGSSQDRFPPRKKQKCSEATEVEV